jgi:hypothetical protein
MEPPREDANPARPPKFASSSASPADPLRAKRNKSHRQDAKSAKARQALGSSWRPWRLGGERAPSERPPQLLRSAETRGITGRLSPYLPSHFPSRFSDLRDFGRKLPGGERRRLASNSPVATGGRSASVGSGDGDGRAGSRPPTRVGARRQGAGGYCVGPGLSHAGETRPRGARAAPKAGEQGRSVNTAARPALPENVRAERRSESKRYQHQSLRALARRSAALPPLNPPQRAPPLAPLLLASP